VRKRHPGHFALGKPVDPAVAESIADRKRTPGTVGMRMLLVHSDCARTPPISSSTRCFAARSGTQGRHTPISPPTVARNRARSCGRDRR
jgi:hypothetical protein